MTIDKIRLAHRLVTELDNLAELNSTLHTDVVDGAPHYEGYVHRDGGTFRIQVDGTTIKADRVFMDFLKNWISNRITELQTEIRNM